MCLDYKTRGGGERGRLGLGEVCEAQMLSAKKQHRYKVIALNVIMRIFKLMLNNRLADMNVNINGFTKK